MKRKQNNIGASPPLKKDILFAAIACVSAIAVSIPSIDGEFLNWDDDRFIVNNPKGSALTVDNIADAFSGLRFESYQPLHLLSYMVDGSLRPNWAPLYRLHNLVLYLAGVLLLYGWLRRIGFSPGPSLGGCLFFALAPYRVESVAWITGRKDVLMLVFFFTAWHLHLLADKSPAHSWKLRGLSTVSFICALLSKSSAVVLPLMMIALDIGTKRKSPRQAVATSLIYLAPAAAIAIALPLIWSDASLIQQTQEDAGSRAALIAWTLTHYLKTVVWPFALSPLYALPDQNAVHRDAIICAALLIVSGAIYASCRKKKISCAVPATAGAMFISALLPFLNGIPLYYLRADRYLLLPSVGLAFGAAAIFKRIFDKRTFFSKIAALVISAFIFAMGIAAAMESYQWHDSMRLWQHAVNREPDAYFARLKLGETLRNAGKPAESVRQYRAALSIKPLSPTALGGVFWGALLQDMDDAGQQDTASAEKLAFQFVSIADDGPKLQSLLRYLKNRRRLRAAAVVEERLGVR